MVQAELMIGHKVIVLHAMRLTGDRETILRQLAMACYHFQLITEKQV
jgi:hypothetical protein